MKYWLIGVACLCGMVALVNYARAQQPQCGSRAGLVAMLDQKYHEVQIAIGMVNEQFIMETFASNDGTWTMFMTNTLQISCIVAAGENWQFDTSAFDKAKKGTAL